MLGFLFPMRTYIVTVFFKFLIRSFTFEELKVQVLEDPSNLKDGMVVILLSGKSRDVDHVLVVVTTTW